MCQQYAQEFKDIIETIARYRFEKIAKRYDVKESAIWYIRSRFNVRKFNYGNVANNLSH